MITKEKIKEQIVGRRFKFGLVLNKMLTETITSKDDLLFRIDVADGTPEETKGIYHSMGYDYRIGGLLIRIKPWIE